MTETIDSAVSVGAPSNSSGWLENFEGTIFFHTAPVPGDAGLDSDFDDATYTTTDAVLLHPDQFQVVWSVENENILFSNRNRKPRCASWLAI
jgi:hypothetical protein